jgi:hypothetical protein
LTSTTPATLPVAETKRKSLAEARIDHIMRLGISGPRWLKTPAPPDDRDWPKSELA